MAGGKFSILLLLLLLLFLLLYYAILREMVKQMTEVEFFLGVG